MAKSSPSSPLTLTSSARERSTQNSLSPKPRILSGRIAIAGFAMVTLFVSSGSGQAANQTWTGAADANWPTGSNWSGGAAPGIVNPTALQVGSNFDIATFNSALVNGT